MKKQLLTVIFAAMAVPGLAFAQDAWVYLEQAGDNNDADIHQMNNAGGVGITQRGGEATLSAWQGAGSDNELNAEQLNSAGTDATLVQWGSGNDLTLLTEDSAGATLNVWQGHTGIASTNSVLEITQKNSAEAVAYVIQEGDANVIELSQLNSVGADANLHQTGQRNLLAVTQDAAPDSVVIGYQVGEDNEATVTQTDGNFGAFFEQIGNGNLATIEQGFQPSN